MDKYYNNPDIQATNTIYVQKDLDRNRAHFLASHDILPAKVVTLKDPYRSGNIGIVITGVHDPKTPASDVLFAPMLMPFGGGPGRNDPNGSGYGFFAMPAVGSDVMVTFLDGDLKNPVILGSWQSRTMITKPASQISSNEISSVIASGSNYRALNTTVLTPGAKAYSDSKQNFQLDQLTIPSQDAIKGFAAGQMEDIITGYVGQVLGPVTGIPLFNGALNSVLGPSLTAVMNTLADNATTAINTAVGSGSSIPLLLQGKAQVTSLFSQLSSAFTTISTELPILASNLKEMPGLVSEGLSTLTNDAFTGVLGTDIQNSLMSATPALKTQITNYIQEKAISGLLSSTSIAGVSSGLDSVLKATNLSNAVTSGRISEPDAIKALENDTVDWLLSKENGGDTIQIYGPQCPLPYKNQTPGRTIETLGQNLTQNTPIDQEELNSCYLSRDLDTSTETNATDALNPSPACYIWKSPEGSAIEIDDTGYAENGKGLDNRGVRLTTKKGALVHLIDEKDGECILIRDKNNNYIWINTITNDINIFTGNNMGEKITKDKTTTCVNMSETMTGSQVTSVAKDQKESIVENKYSNTGLNRIENVGKNWTISINGDATIYSNGNTAVTAEKQVFIGSGIRSTLESETEVRIKAPIINIEGGVSGTYMTSPYPIHIASAVLVHLKAPLITMGST